MRTFEDKHAFRTGYIVSFMIEIQNGSNIQMLMDYNDVTMETESLVYDPALPFQEQDTVRSFSHRYTSATY